VTITQNLEYEKSSAIHSFIYLRKRRNWRFCGFLY
jgi:hypothetical protein